MNTHPEVFFSKIYTQLAVRGKKIQLPVRFDGVDKGVTALSLTYDNATLLKLGKQAYGVLCGHKAGTDEGWHVAELVAVPDARDGKTLTEYIGSLSFKYSLMGADAESIFLSKKSAFYKPMRSLLEESDLFTRREIDGSTVYAPSVFAYTPASAAFIAEGIEKLLKHPAFASADTSRVA
ncbi:MAG TPA: hypothetical protein VLJ21_04940 [Candidatus Binatia bacterium]|nr:hypothetical protein [Candidatus Binatia bacterium]